MEFLDRFVDLEIEPFCCQAAAFCWSYGQLHCFAALRLLLNLLACSSFHFDPVVFLAISDTPLTDLIEVRLFQETSKISHIKTHQFLTHFPVQSISQFSQRCAALTPSIHSSFTPRAPSALVIAVGTTGTRMPTAVRAHTDPKPIASSSSVWAPT